MMGIRQITATGLLIGLMNGSTGGAALAQDEAWDEPLLSGPRIEAEEEAGTLVRRDFNGRLVRLERPAEVAALDMLEIGDEMRERIDAIVAERSAILDTIVRENVELLIELQAAGQSDSRLDVLPVLGKLSRAMKPLRERGPLRAEIIGVLEDGGTGGAQVGRFEALVDGYFSAYVEDVRRATAEMGEEVGPRQAERRARLELMGEEIRRAYERLVQGDGGRFERVLASLDLTPEQEGQIRELVTEFVQETLLNPTQKQERRLFFRIAARLTPKQRRELVEQFEMK